MQDDRLPPALRRRNDRAAIHEDISPYRGTTPEQRARILGVLCRFATEQIRARPDGWRILAHQDRRSPASEQLWLRLIAASRST